MQTYIIFTRLSPSSFESGEQFRQLAKRVSQRIKREAPKAHWKQSYALMGRFDVLDIVEAESAADAERAAPIIRSGANATTETMLATPCIRGNPEQLKVFNLPCSHGCSAAGRAMPIRG